MEPLIPVSESVHFEVNVSIQESFESPMAEPMAFFSEESAILIIEESLPQEAMVPKIKTTLPSALFYLGVCPIYHINTSS